MAEEKTVVVAGATGRAGRLVVQELLKRGYRVRALMVP
ncbi:MAG: NmrA family NAD(P)-binding protein, partial [Deltaproteobacteria bacterium]|nr:NmrA family NAD(P)-binding protein [Deltaproteobacteria bacterium]